MSVFLGTVQAGIFKFGKHMEDERLYCGIETWAGCSCSSIFSSPVRSIERYCHFDISMGIGVKL